MHTPNPEALQSPLLLPEVDARPTAIGPTQHSLVRVRLLRLLLPLLLRRMKVWEVEIWESDTWRWEGGWASNCCRCGSSTIWSASMDNIPPCHNNHDHNRNHTPFSTSTRSHSPSTLGTGPGTQYNIPSRLRTLLHISKFNPFKGTHISTISLRMVVCSSIRMDLDNRTLFIGTDNERYTCSYTSSSVVSSQQQPPFTVVPPHSSSRFCLRCQLATTSLSTSSTTAVDVRSSFRRRGSVGIVSALPPATLMARLRLLGIGGCCGV